MQSLLALSSFVLSVGLVIRGVWTKRAASLEARLERYADAWPDGRPRARHRLVVVNHGPARARDVTVRLVNEHGADYVGTLLTDKHLLPVPVLHAGQDFHSEVVVSYGANPARGVVLAWSDGRRKRQTLTVWLSARQII